MILTNQEIRQHIQVSAENEPRVRSVVKAVEAEFTNRTRRIWTKIEDQTDVYDTLTEDLNTIFLKSYPVLGNLVVKERDTWTDSWTELTADVDFRSEAGMLIPLRDPAWLRFVQVTADVGYEPGTVPDDIKRALILETIRTLGRDADEKIIVASSSIQGGGATTLIDPEKEHPAFERAILRYRRRPS